MYRNGSSSCTVNSAALLSFCSTFSFLSDCSYQHCLNQCVSAVSDSLAGHCCLSVLLLSFSLHQCLHNSYSPSLFFTCPHLITSFFVSFFPPPPIPRYHSPFQTTSLYSTVPSHISILLTPPSFVCLSQYAADSSLLMSSISWELVNCVRSVLLQTTLWSPLRTWGLVLCPLQCVYVCLPECLLLSLSLSSDFLGRI